MHIFLEVTNGDWGWLRKTGPDSPDKRGLKAPINTKHLILFKKMSRNDIVLTYLARTFTDNHEWRSSIVGISKVKDKFYQMDNSFKVDTYDDRELPTPIIFQRFSKIEGPSELFKYLLRVRLQKYLFEIETSDFVKILKICPENAQFLKSVNYFKDTNEMRKLSEIS
jgi:hypothetical protein